MFIIEVNFVFGFFKLIFFHFNFDDGIRLFSRLFLLNFKDSRGLSRRFVVDLDVGLRLLQWLWLNDVDDALRLSGWLWFLNLDVDLLLRR